jgi:hypothetical protein
MERSATIFPGSMSYLDMLPPDLKNMCPAKILTDNVILPAIEGLDLSFPRVPGISSIHCYRDDTLVASQTIDMANRVPVSEPVFFSCDDTVLVSLCDGPPNNIDICVKSIANGSAKVLARDYLCKEGEIFVMIRMREEKEASSKSTESFITAHREFERASSCYNLLLNQFDWECEQKKLTKKELRKIPFGDIIHAFEYNPKTEQIILGTERGSCPALLYLFNKNKAPLKVAEYAKPCDSFRMLHRLSDGSILAVHANGRVVKWNFKNEDKPEQELIFNGIVPQRQIWEPKLDFAGDISPDETKLYLGIFNGQIFLVDLKKKEAIELQKTHQRERLRAVHFFPNNTSVVCSRNQGGGQNLVEVWDTRLNLMLAYTNSRSNAIDVSSDGNKVALENSIWDVSFLRHLRGLSLGKVIDVLDRIEKKRRAKPAGFTNDDKLDIAVACIKSGSSLIRARGEQRAVCGAAQSRV